MIKSMTGYGSAKGTVEGIEVSVELKSVNNKFLDTSIRLPRSFLFAEETIKQAVSSHISRGKVDVFVSVDSSAAGDMSVKVNEPLLRGYAETGEYALIISLGYSQGSSVEAVAPNYPDQNFMLIDAEVDCENVACYSWRENELSYMVGVMAGMMTKSNVIGFIAAFDIYNCNMNAAGLTAGAQSVNPDVQVLVDYLGSWDDIAACKEMAIAMHDKGADIIYHAASTAGLGILEAGKENGFYTIGFDGNVNADAPDTNMASAIRLFPVAADDAIHAAMDGTFQGGTISLGCAEDACVVDAEGSNVEIPDDVWAAMDAAKAGIADGSISVPKTLEEVNG